MIWCPDMPQLYVASQRSMLLNRCPRDAATVYSNPLDFSVNGWATRLRILNVSVVTFCIFPVDKSQTTRRKQWAGSISSSWRKAISASCLIKEISFKSMSSISSSPENPASRFPLYLPWYAVGLRFPRRLPRLD